MRRITNIALVSLLFLASACEPFYDPVEADDVPPSPGRAWTVEPINYKETAEKPYDISNLTESMPLSQLLEIALYNNPSTRASWNAARAAAYEYHTTFSTYYPSIGYVGNLAAQTQKGTAFASSGTNIISSGTTAITQTHSVNQTNQVALTYLVLDFGGRKAETDLALQVLYASDWTHNLTMQQVMLSVLTAYTGYIGNKGLVEGYAQDLKDYQVALDAAKVMHTAGLATLTDVLLAQSNLELTRTNLIQAQGAEQTSIGEILISVGLDPDTPISVANLPQELPVIEISGNISELLETARENRPDLGVAIAAIKQQEAQLAISYSNSMPTLKANSSWNHVRFIWPPNPSGYNETASLQFTMPLFEGFFYLNQQRQIRAQIEEAMANLDVQLNAIYSQVVTFYYSFKSAEAALPSAVAAVAFSQRAYTGFIIQYRTGTASILDVLTALTSLSNARAQLILIRTQWASALANLAFAIGVLEDTSGEWEKAPPKNLEQIPIKDDNVPTGN